MIAAVLIVVAWLASLAVVWSWGRAAALGDRQQLRPREPRLPWPVQPPPNRTPYLNAVCTLGVALVVGLVAAVAGLLGCAGLLGWLIGAGVVAVGALIVIALLEMELH